MTRIVFTLAFFMALTSCLRAGDVFDWDKERKVIIVKAKRHYRQKLEQVVGCAISHASKNNVQFITFSDNLDLEENVEAKDKMISLFKQKGYVPFVDGLLMRQEDRELLGSLVQQSKVFDQACEYKFYDFVHNGNLGIFLQNRKFFEAAMPEDKQGFKYIHYGEDNPENLDELFAFMEMTGVSRVFVDGDYEGDSLKGLLNQITLAPSDSVFYVSEKTLQGLSLNGDKLKLGGDVSMTLGDIEQNLKLTGRKAVLPPVSAYMDQNTYTWKNYAEVCKHSVFGCVFRWNFVQFENETTQAKLLREVMENPDEASNAKKVAKVLNLENDDRTKPFNHRKGLIKEICGLFQKGDYEFFNEKVRGFLTDSGFKISKEPALPAHILEQHHSNE